MVGGWDCRHASRAVPGSSQENASENAPDIAYHGGQQYPDICKYVQGSDAASLLREKLRVQLVQVAATYSTCLLCLEGSAAFELSVMSRIDELIALACRCGVALSIITARSPAELEVRRYLAAPHTHLQAFCFPPVHDCL